MSPHTKSSSKQADAIPLQSGFRPARTAAASACPATRRCCPVDHITLWMAWCAPSGRAAKSSRTRPCPVVVLTLVHTTFNVLSRSRRRPSSTFLIGRSDDGSTSRNAHRGRLRIGPQYKIGPDSTSKQPGSRREFRQERLCFSATLDAVCRVPGRFRSPAPRTARNCPRILDSDECFTHTYSEGPCRIRLFSVGAFVQRLSLGEQDCNINVLAILPAWKSCRVVEPLLGDGPPLPCPSPLVCTKQREGKEKRKKFARLLQPTHLGQQTRRQQAAAVCSLFG